MDFWYEKEVDEDTEEKDAEEEPMQLKAGTIKHIWILHPPGCWGYLHTQILHRGHVVAPAVKGGSYHGDTFPMEFDDDLKIKKPAVLTIRSWNLDEEEPHTVYVRVTVMPEPVEPWQQALLDLLASFKRFMGVE